MKEYFFENSIEYEAEIAEWREKLTDLMKREKYAAVAILGYYFGDSSCMLGCPLGDPEFERIGTEMQKNPALFTAAENVGLIAEGVSDIFYDALDNPGSWCYHHDKIRYIFENEGLSRHVPYRDRYLAEALLSGGKDIYNDDDDRWHKIFDVAKQTQEKRNMRGF